MNASMEEQILAELKRRAAFEELILRLAIEAGCSSVTVDWGDVFPAVARFEIAEALVRVDKSVARHERVLRRQVGPNGEFFHEPIYCFTEEGIDVIERHGHEA